MRKLAGDAWRRRCALTCTALAAVIAWQPAMAQQPDRWVVDEALASATLPAPSAGEMVSTTLSCEAQRWSIRLDLGDDAKAAAGPATMTVGSRVFEVETRPDGNVLAARLPREAIEPLKNGSRLELTLAGTQGETASLVYSLRGSKLAISAAQERCSLRDMSAYQPVTFTPYSSYLDEAKALRAADIDTFVQATASQPKLDVAMVELDEGRRLLFTRLCGSSWYYGLSGCNITGFAPVPAQPAEGGEGDQVEETTWRSVYDTENVLLYLDQKRSRAHGWPDVVTLPVGAAGTGLIWRWDGRSYALKGELPEDKDDFDPQALRQGRD